MTKGVPHRVENARLAIEAHIERLKPIPPPSYFPPEFVSLVYAELRDADKRVRESVPLREPSAKKPSRARPPARRSRPVNFTKQAELWFRGIGTYSLLSANVPSARSIMYAAGKRAGLKVRTEHRGHGLVVGFVIEEREEA